MRGTIRFVLNGEPVEIGGFAPTTTLLDYIRGERRLTGTKEGCGEGDCGACTVALGRPADGRMVYRPVNACILLLGQVDGAEVITVEHLAEGEELHPVQAAMVEHHGSQCGFCTPGIVMSLFTLHLEGRCSERQAVLDRLAGNLCRCTGYRPIVEAALTAAAQPVPDRFARRTPALCADEKDVLIPFGNGGFFAAPASIDSLARLYRDHPQARLVAGATDVGLWITKQLKDLPQLIWLGRVRELSRITESPDAVEIGAAVTYADAFDSIARIDPDLGELWRRIGSAQVRASGTVGGNIANGSPIGDTPPALIALGAMLTLRKGDTLRRLPLEDFFIAYGKQDLAEAEFVSSVTVPRPGPHDHFRAYKVSKRFDQDISAVMGAFRLTVQGRRVSAARIAFGGMAATPKRARAVEAALVSADLDAPASWRPALEALREDFTPIDDLRASAAYRMAVARGLVEKALTEIGGRTSAATRVVGLREASDAAAA